MLNLLWFLKMIISTTIEWVVFKFLLDEISEIKRSKTSLRISLISAVLLIVFLTEINFDVNIKLIIAIIMSCRIYLYNYKVSALKSVLISILYQIVLIGFDSLGLCIVSYINGINDMTMMIANNNFYNLEITILSKLLLILFVPCIKFFKIDFSINKNECLHLSMPIISNLASILFMFGYIIKDSKISQIESIIILVLSIVITFSNISLIRIINRIIKDRKIRDDYLLIKEKADMQYKYYKGIQKYQDKVRKLYHDMNNHMVCIKNIYGKNEMVDMYIEDLNRQVKECKNNFRTGSIILDVILEEKNYICNKRGIDFNVDIKFEKCKFIEMTDVCSIFSNIIDNAIDACNKIEDNTIKKEIRLRGTQINKTFVIRCDNSKVNSVNIKEDRIITDKDDNFLHGIGIESIKSSVKKYDGNVEIASKENTFSIMLYIPLE